MKIPVLTLPHDFRNDLVYPQGTLIVHPERGCIFGVKADVTVGDVVSRRHTSKIKVVDFKTKRVQQISPAETSCILVVNPRGCLSLSSVTFSMLSNTDLCVIGEEDMLTLAFLPSQADTIMYGQPDVGVVLVKPCIRKALKALKILKPSVIQVQ